MALVALLALALAAGLTIGGLVGTVMEAMTRTRLGFREPFVSSEFVGLSVLATAATGPFMLTNDALAARRYGAIGFGSFAALLAMALLWATASGILAVELAALAMGR